jgi:hypothetical protein
MHLISILESTGGTTTGFRIPDEVVESLGAGARPKVVARVGAHSWRTSIARMGGEYWLGMSAAHRTAAGVAAGDEVALGIAVDDAPRTVEVPEDLAAALAADPEAAAAWERLSYSHQRAHAEPLAAAKKPETRERRLAAILEKLRG